MGSVSRLHRPNAALLLADYVACFEKTHVKRSRGRGSKTVLLQTLDGVIAQARRVRFCQSLIFFDDAPCPLSEFNMFPLLKIGVGENRGAVSRHVHLAFWLREASPAEIAVSTCASPTGITTNLDDRSLADD